MRRTAGGFAEMRDRLFTKTAAAAKNIIRKNFSGESITTRQMAGIFIPIIVDQAFIICLSFLNTAMISSSGMAAVSAVSMVDSLNIFLVNVFIAVATGGTVVVAQYKGKGVDAMVSRAAAGALATVFLLAAATAGAVILLHTQVLNVLFGNAEPDVFRFARIYLIGSCISYPGVAATEAVCGALRGVGQTKSSLMLSVISNVSYVIFNFVFITLLHMSVTGMVISLNISRWLGAVCSVLYILFRNTSFRFQLLDLLRVDLSMLHRIFSIGIPFAAEQMFFNGGKILTQTFIVQLGTYAMTTNAVCNSMVQLFQIPANAFCLGIVTVVGQCMGRRDVKDAKKFIRSFLFLTSFSFLVMDVILLPAFPLLVKMFSPAAEIVPTIRSIEFITAVYQIPVWGISFMLPSALRAAGDSKFTSMMSMLSMWLFRVVLGYILGIHTSLGILGVWLAMDCEWVVRGTIYMARFHGHKWHEHHVID